jgi:YbgC/YbaW family acyl-CoA thioester hydrolase
MGIHHICRLEVRGYELDSYQHVNHAVYLSYLEHARWKFLSDHGIRHADFARWQRSPVIAHADVSYLRPAYIGQELEIHSEITEHGRSWFLVDQEIRFEGAPILRAKMRVVMVNEKGRPAEAPAEVARLWGSSGTENE